MTRTARIIGGTNIVLAPLLLGAGDLLRLRAEKVEESGEWGLQEAAAQLAAIAANRDTYELASWLFLAAALTAVPARQRGDVPRRHPRRSGADGGAARGHWFANTPAGNAQPAGRGQHDRRSVRFGRTSTEQAATAAAREEIEGLRPPSPSRRW